MKVIFSGAQEVPLTKHVSKILFETEKKLILIQPILIFNNFSLPILIGVFELKYLHLTNSYLNTAGKLSQIQTFCKKKLLTDVYRVISITISSNPLPKMSIYFPR